MIRKITLSLAILVGLLTAAIARAEVTPDQALSLLLKGNRHFAAGELKYLNKMSEPAVRQELATGQKPYAVVLTCSDSRVPPEILFDKGLGEIFVIRVAGNVVSPHELGSIEYAIEHLGASLIMVLGHERCGAVTATYDAHVAGALPGGNIGSIIQSIDPAVSEILGQNPAGSREDIVEACIVENIRNVAQSLEEDSPVIREAVEQKRLKIIAAKYDLDDGIVAILDRQQAESGAALHGHDLMKEAALETLTVSITTKPLARPLSPTGAKLNLVTLVPSGTTAETLQSAVANLPEWVTLAELPKVAKTKGTIILQLAANGTYVERQATISVGSSPFDIRQAGIPCPVPLLSQAAVTLPASGGTAPAIGVSLPEGCGWSITLPAETVWLSVTPPGGSGSGSFILSAVANNVPRDMKSRVTVLTKNNKKSAVSVLQNNLVGQYAGNYSGTFTGNYSGTFTGTISKTGAAKANLIATNGLKGSESGKVNMAGEIIGSDGKAGQVSMTADGKAHIYFEIHNDDVDIYASGVRN